MQVLSNSATQTCKCYRAGSYYLTIFYIKRVFGYAVAEIDFG